MQLTILFAVLSLLGFGLDQNLSQDAAQALGSKQALFWRGLILSIALGVVAIITTHRVNPTSLAIGLGIGLLGYIPVLCFYQALRIGKLGVVVPIATANGLITTLLAIGILHERLSAPALGAILIIISGTIGLSLDLTALRQRKFIFAEGTLFSLLACLGWGVVFFLYKYPTDALGPTLSAFLIEFGVFVMSALHLALRRDHIVRGVQRVLPRLAAMSACAFIGVLSFTLAIERGPVAVTVTIASAGGVIGLLYGRVIKGDHLRVGQYISAALIISGIIALNQLK